MKRFYTLFLLMFLILTNANSQYWKEIKTISPPYSTNYWLDVFFHPSNPNFGWVCGFQGMVIRTTDGGQTWAGSVVAGANHLEHVHFPTLTTGYTSGPSGIYKSVNGGQTWTNITPDITSDYWGCYFVNENTGLVIGGGCDGVQEFYRTTDGGQNWTLFSDTELNSGLTDLILYDAEGLGYAVSSGNLWRTTDGGRTWDTFASTGSNIWHEEITNTGLSFLLPYAGTNCSGQGGDGGMRFTSDLGVSWYNYQTGSSMFGTFLTSSMSGWACGDNQSVYYTSNGGVAWKNKNCGIRPDADLDDIWFINPNLGFVVGNGVYVLSPPEYLLSKDTLYFDNICKGEAKLDSLNLELLSFDNANAEFEIIDNPGNHFQLVAPTAFKVLNSCSVTKIVVRFFPLDELSHRARLKVTLNPGTLDEQIKYVHLEGIIKKSTAFPQDTLIVLNNVVCNTVRNVTLPWFVENDNELIVEIRRINFINGIRYNHTLPFTIKKPVTNFNFEIQIPDTGWFEERFKYTILPCSKDTFITIRAYGISPIISHKAKNLLTSECLETVYDTIRIFNTGNAVLDIGQITIMPGQSEFSIIGWVNNPVPVKINPKEYADLVIVYSPKNYGTHNAILNIINNDSTKVFGDKNPYKINLKGESQGVVLNDSLFVDLGDICLGQRKIQSVRLHNRGNLDAILAMRNIPIEMIITLNDINSKISKNDSVTIRLEYNANKKGIFRHEIEFTAEPCNQKTILVVTGRVITNEIEIIPNEIKGIVKTGEVHRQTVRVNSLSDVNINIKSITLEPQPTDWTYSYTPSVPMVLLPAQGADFAFEFTPLAASKLVGKIKIETDGICAENFYIDVDLSSFSRIVDVKPDDVDYGLILCESESRFFDVVITNRGFSEDTITKIDLVPTNSNFIIDNLPQLPYYIQAEEQLVLKVRFTPTTEGIFTAEINIKTSGIDGQSFTIPLKGEFRKSEILPKIHNVDFGIMELCSQEKILSVDYTNSGTLDDSLKLVSYNGNSTFSIIGDSWLVPAGGSATIEIIIEPDKFDNLGNLTGKFNLRSVVCSTDYEINASVKSVKPVLEVTPALIEFAEKWSEETAKSTVRLNNIGEIDVRIDLITLSNDTDFKFVTNPTGQIVPKSSEISFEIEYISSLSGEHFSDIFVKYSAECADSLQVPISGKVREEIYENLIYIDRYEAVAGELIDIYVNLKDGIERIDAERIDFEIKFDKYLFYPRLVQSRFNNGFADVAYTYSGGILSGTIENNFAKDLLKQSGGMIQIRGLVLSSLPDNTDLEITKFEVTTDKPLTIEKNNGHLKLIDYCPETTKLGRFILMPRFKVKSGSIATNGIFNFEINSTADVSVGYRVVDIFGSVQNVGQINPGRDFSKQNILLTNIASGSYFIIFESQFQSEMINVINIK